MLVAFIMTQKLEVYFIFHSIRSDFVFNFVFRCCCWCCHCYSYNNIFIHFVNFVTSLQLRRSYFFCSAYHYQSKTVTNYRVSICLNSMIAINLPCVKKSLQRKQLIKIVYWMHVPLRLTERQLRLQ